MSSGGFLMALTREQYEALGAGVICPPHPSEVGDRAALPQQPPEIDWIEINRAFSIE
jgi:hypothetical protein